MALCMAQSTFGQASQNPTTVTLVCTPNEGKMKLPGFGWESVDLEKLPSWKRAQTIIFEPIDILGAACPIGKWCRSTTKYHGEKIQTANSGSAWKSDWSIDRVTGAFTVESSEGSATKLQSGVCVKGQIQL